MRRHLYAILGVLLCLAMLAGCAGFGGAEGPLPAEVTSAGDSSGESQPETPPSQESQLGSEEADPECSLPQEAIRTEEALAEIAKLGESPDDHYRTWYEVFVYSYCDSNGDGIGDLNGLRSKLPALKELGINGLWLMPVHPSTSYHKYNADDYYAIDPAYGTMDDMEALLTECGELGIRVILDLVLNHTGNEHPWFTAATAYLAGLSQGEEPNEADCPYVSYYHFQRGEAGGGYHAIPGTDWCYEGVFSPEMPDLNWDNEALRSDVREIMKFWLEKGVAGFRLDAAKEFYSGNNDKNVEVLSWIQQTATELNPDCYLVAEVWDSFSMVTKYYTSGITSVFNYPFGNSNGKIIKVLQSAGNPSMVTTYATALEKADQAYRSSNPNYIDAPFLSNHDVGRIAGFVAQDENKIKLAGAMNLFMSGSTFIYYGEEIGMPGSGNDPSKRAPMYWNEARDAGTTTPPPGCALPAEYPLGSLESQRDDDTSVYNYYRQAIAIRNALPVISHGTVTAEAGLNQGCVSAYRKTWDEEECLILMNVDDSAAEVDLSAYADWTLAASLSADGNEIKIEGTTLSLPAYGVAVLLP